MTKDLIARLLNCDPADVLTSGEAAAKLGITARAVTAAAKRGRLNGYQFGEGRGSLWYFLLADIETYAASKKTWKPPTPPAAAGDGRRLTQD